MNKASLVSILVVAVVVALAAYYRSERRSDAETHAVASSELATTADASGVNDEEDDLLDMPAAIGEDAPIDAVDDTPSGAGAATQGTQSVSAAKSKRPRLVDLGADKCIACKKLAPILDTLREEYEGRLDVEFIDVWKNPDAKRPYNIRLIPTQILYDAEGKEVWRHEGFIGKDELKRLFAEKVGVK